MLSARKLALAAMKACSRSFGASVNCWRGAFSMSGIDDPVAQRLHRAEIGLRVEARARPVLEIFVAREPLVGIDAVRQPQRAAGDRDAVLAILRVRAERTVGPQAVHDEARSRAARALARRLVGAAGVAEPGRPGQGEDVEIEIARRLREAGRRARAPARRAGIRRSFEGAWSIPLGEDVFARRGKPSLPPRAQ